MDKRDEEAGLKHFKYPKTFMKYSSDMHNACKGIHNVEKTNSIDRV